MEIAWTVSEEFSILGIALISFGIIRDIDIGKKLPAYEEGIIVQMIRAKMMDLLLVLGILFIISLVKGSNNIPNTRVYLLLSNRELLAAFIRNAENKPKKGISHTAFPFRLIKDVIAPIIDREATRGVNPKKMALQ